jgi:hypothetical protein
MKGVVSNALHAKGVYLGQRIEPLMRDTFLRVQNLDYSYDKAEWGALLYALTEIVPEQIGNMPFSKEDRLEMLAMLDFVDRGLQEKGPEGMADTLFMSFVALFDLFDSFKNALKLRILHDGVDITEDIFGRKVA